MSPAITEVRLKLARGLYRLGRSLEPRNSVVTRVIREKLTYLEEPALHLLWRQVREIEQLGLEGCIIETGCALGGSALVLGAGKLPRRPMYLYDTFGLIPPPSDRDGEDVHQRYKVIVSGASEGISGDTYYGYRPDLLSQVKETFRRYGMPPDSHAVTFVQGRYEDTLYPGSPIALAHIDCDWYESVNVSLERIVPQLAAGGRIIIDDYFAYSGCRTAVWDFFRNRQNEFVFRYGTRLIIERAVMEPALSSVRLSHHSADGSS